MKSQIEQSFFKAVGQKATFEHPSLLDHGDFATSTALSLFKKGTDPTPLDLANKLANQWRSKGLPDFIGKIEVVHPGFINVWLSQEYLLSQLQTVLDKKENFGKNENLKGQKILLEHTSPSPQTTITLGHARNNFLGMTTARLLEFSGAKVNKDCINNDRGVHVCRAMWGYLVFARKNGGLTKNELKDFRQVKDTQVNKLSSKIDWKQLITDWSNKKNTWFIPADLDIKSDHANLIWYVLGSRSYKMSDKFKSQVDEILQAWESNDRKVRDLWATILKWTKEGYDQTYKRLGSRHDWVWNESDHYQKGKEIVAFGLEKGVFRKSQGAIVTNLAKYKLPDTVVIKSDGTALYITQDLALTKLKTQKFPSDLYIWDVGNEQVLYLKQVFAVCEQLGIGKTNQFFHLNYALINIKGGGKMSTRSGNVVTADEVLDLLHQKAKDLILGTNKEFRAKLSDKQLDTLSEQVGDAAVKYSLLRFARETTIGFDIEESLSLTGNSGPYLQYTNARALSVLRKEYNNYNDYKNYKSYNSEELTLLRMLYRFPEVVWTATQTYSPNIIANYLYELAQAFNLFYDKHTILNAIEPGQKEFRLQLTTAISQILKNGLSLFGIATPEKM